MLPPFAREFTKAQIDQINKVYKTGGRLVIKPTRKQIEYRSDDVIKMKFVKLWDLLSYSERTTSKTPTRQKLAIRGKLSLRY